MSAVDCLKIKIIPQTGLTQKLKQDFEGKEMFVSVEKFRDEKIVDGKIVKEVCFMIKIVSFCLSYIYLKVSETSYNNFFFIY